MDSTSGKSTGQGSPEEEVNTDKLEFRNILPTHYEDEEPTDSKEQTHTFTNFPHSDDTDEEDKNDLLNEGKKKKPSFWTFEYYQQFFDVEARQVVRRLLGSMIPNPKVNFLQQDIRPNPDLYGPFWVCATLVFTTAIAGNMANYIQTIGKDFIWQYDFHKVTFAAAAIFCYWWVIPGILWAFLTWRGNQIGLTFLEIICVYGYSLTIYVPISLLWVIPLTWLQWLLVIIGAALSGIVLVMTFWPAVRQDNRTIAIVAMILVVVFHTLLAIGFVLYFFYVPAKPQSVQPVGNSTTTVVPEGTMTMLPG